MPKITILGKLGLTKGMPVATIIKRIIAVLKWNISPEKRLKKARFVIQEMTGNPLFTIPYAAIITPLATLVTDTDLYDAALTLAATHADGTAEAADVAGEVVHQDLISIMSMVQAKMDDDRVNAIVIASGAGFDTKTESKRGPRKAGVYQGNEPGSFVIHSDMTGQHEWQESTDNGATFKDIGSSSGGEYSVEGKIPDKRYYYRGRQVLTWGRKGEWGPWRSNTAPA